MISEKNMISQPAQSLKIINEDDSRIREISKSVIISKIETEDFQKFLSQLYATMLVEGGIGIAAPQVGMLQRICIVSDEGKNPQILINPEITWFSRDTVGLPEGCLSVPGAQGEVIRPKSIHVKGLNEQGEKVKIKAKGWLSRVIQHEVDHLDGILFIDKAVSLSYSHDKRSPL